jgi:hypothetical protein
LRTGWSFVSSARAASQRSMASEVEQLKKPEHEIIIGSERAWNSLANATPGIGRLGIRNAHPRKLPTSS